MWGIRLRVQDGAFGMCGYGEEKRVSWTELTLFPMWGGAFSDTGECVGVDLGGLSLPLGTELRIEKEVNGECPQCYREIAYKTWEDNRIGQGLIAHNEQERLEWVTLSSGELTRWPYEWGSYDGEWFVLSDVNNDVSGEFHEAVLGAGHAERFTLGKVR